MHVVCSSAADATACRLLEQHSRGGCSGLLDGMTNPCMYHICVCFSRAAAGMRNKPVSRMPLPYIYSTLGLQIHLHDGAKGPVVCTCQAIGDAGHYHVLCV